MKIIVLNLVAWALGPLLVYNWRKLASGTSSGIVGKKLSSI
jgi:hypothetical protein